VTTFTKLDVSDAEMRTINDAIDSGKLTPGPGKAHVGPESPQVAPGEVVLWIDTGGQRTTARVYEG
jgi:hypothetical protein